MLQCFFLILSTYVHFNITISKLKTISDTNQNVIGISNQQRAFKQFFWPHTDRSKWKDPQMLHTPQVSIVSTDRMALPPPTPHGVFKNNVLAKGNVGLFLFSK